MEDTLAHIPAEALEEVARDLPLAEDERARERLAELEKEVCRSQTTETYLICLESTNLFYRKHLLRRQ